MVGKQAESNGLTAQVVASCASGRVHGGTENSVLSEETRSARDVFAVGYRKGRCRREGAGVDFVSVVYLCACLAKLPVLASL